MAATNAPISAANAICDLTALRDAVDTAQAELVADVRRVLRPAGFGREPETWEDTADAVLTALNQDYCYESVVEITENTRKIGRKGGLDKLVLQVFEMTNLFNTARESVRNFETLYSNGRAQLSPVDHVRFDDGLNSFRKLMVVFELQMNASRTKLNDHKRTLRALDVSAADIANLVRPLTTAVYPAQNIAATKVLLRQLAGLSGLRTRVETSSGVLFAIVSQILTIHAPFTPEALNAELARYSTISYSLDQLILEQAAILAPLQESINLATSTPSGISGANGDELSVDGLRRGFDVFDEIYDAVDLMHEMHGPLLAALQRATAQLRFKLRLDVDGVALF
ncbi:hypothetical protein BC628DRAFT_1421695 [Trametes gibbosa]|nr:hypothetical protein BC628DRAFT_1421695 [Trametes gibbosa]